MSIKDDAQETRELCRTLDIKIEMEIVQKRTEPDPHSFIGSGKLEELKSCIGEVDAFVFDGDLKPSQHFRLETTLKRVCTDRLGLILEIFNRHAQSNEAKAQVSLAMIRYEMPFLREWVSKGLSDDRPGFMAGGEYTIDAYYENARRQMKRIEKTLEHVAIDRESKRLRRRDQGFYLVSICGYTNGGKSTLLRSLSGAETLIDDRMFSTLSTMTRRLSNMNQKILVTDTVGFIRNLPPNLINAFNATLEEIFESDCAILVLDLSDTVDVVVEKLQTSLKILIPKVEKSKIVIALNKIDSLSVEDLQRKMNLIEENLLGYTFYLISAQTRKGTDDLIKGILSKVGLTKSLRMVLPNTPEGQRIYRWIAERFIISDASWGKDIELVLQITSDEMKMITNRVTKVVGVKMTPQ